MDITIPAETRSITIQTEKTGLIVVDLQNAFCSKGGMFDSAGMLNEKRIEPVINSAKQIIGAARLKGIKIIYLTMGYRPDLADAGGPESPNYWKEGSIATMREHPELTSKPLTAGSWDAQIVDTLLPQPDDIVVNKNRYSGFANTGLDGILKNNGIKYLLFIGAFTNVCVESTIRDAYFQEYFPILVGDACANVGPDYTQAATIWAVSNVFGWVTTSKGLVESLT
jgi:ureidoacrylate peracid hydrolase